EVVVVFELLAFLLLALRDARGEATVGEYQIPQRQAHVGILGDALGHDVTRPPPPRVDVGHAPRRVHESPGPLLARLPDTNRPREPARGLLAVPRDERDGGAAGEECLRAVDGHAGQGGLRGHDRREVGWRPPERQQFSRALAVATMILVPSAFSQNTVTWARVWSPWRLRPVMIPRVVKGSFGHSTLVNFT